MGLADNIRARVPAAQASRAEALEGRARVEAEIAAAAEAAAKIQREQERVIGAKILEIGQEAAGVIKEYNIPAIPILTRRGESTAFSKTGTGWHVATKHWDDSNPYESRQGSTRYMLSTDGRFGTFVFESTETLMGGKTNPKTGIVNPEYFSPTEHSLALAGSEVMQAILVHFIAARGPIVLDVPDGKELTAQNFESLIMR